MELSVIIVNYNVKYFLEQCLLSVIKAAKGITMEIFVVDNASTDGSREWLEENFPEVRFTWNSYNPGFAIANNQALLKANGEYILFLNPDTILPEDCFRKCIQYFNSHPKAGALGVCMLDGSGNFLKESKRGFPTPMAAFYKLTGLSALFPRSPVYSRYHMGHLDPAKNHETDVLAGAFMMVRKKVLDITGGFDESFFMYGEDIDLSFRIQQAGYKNIYLAECPILHFKGESTRKGTLNYVRLFYGAMAIFVRKHHGGMSAGLFSFCIHLAIWIRAFFSAIGHFIRFILKSVRQLFPVKTTDHTSPIVVGHPEGYQRITDILLQSGRMKSDPLFIPISIDQNGSTGPVKDLPSLVKKYSGKEIIFCENGLSFKDIIQHCRKLPSDTQIRISAHTSRSIVGSDITLSGN
jgi:GT2 family glycosyltransferase